VVASGLLTGAVAVRSVAEKLGIPYYYAVVSPVLLPSSEQRDRYNEGADRIFGDALNSRRAAIGLPPAEKLHNYCCTDRPGCQWTPSWPSAAGRSRRGADRRVDPARRTASFR